MLLANAKTPIPIQISIAGWLHKKTTPVIGFRVQVMYFACVTITNSWILLINVQEESGDAFNSLF